MKGHQIREIRLTIGLTQAELADIVHTTVPTLSRWENDKAAPDTWQARVLQALKLQIKTTDAAHLEAALRLGITSLVSSAIEMARLQATPWAPRTAPRRPHTAPRRRQT